MFTVDFYNAAGCLLSSERFGNDEMDAAKLYIIANILPDMLPGDTMKLTEVE